MQLSDTHTSLHQQGTTWYAFLSLLCVCFLLSSCATPKPGTISDYKYNPFTKVATCKVYIDVTLHQSATDANGAYTVKGEAIVTKDGKNNYSFELPNKGEVKYYGSSDSILSRNLMTVFQVDKGTAGEIAEVMTMAHEYRHQYDVVNNTPLALVVHRYPHPVSKDAPKKMEYTMERNATGAGVLMLTKILQAGGTNGNLSAGWQKMKDKMKDKKFDSDYFREEIFDMSQSDIKTSSFEYDPCFVKAFGFMRAHYGSTKIQNQTNTYDDALLRFLVKGWSDFSEFESDFKLYLEDVFKKAEEQYKDNQQKKIKQKEISRNGSSISIPYILGKIDTLNRVKDLIQNNIPNNQTPPVRRAPATGDYCWSCRVGDPGIPRCTVPSCPNYGNPPSMAR